MVRKKVAKFYRDKQIDVVKLVTRRPKDLTMAQVEAASEEVFRLIRDGVIEVPDIRLATTVWELARKVNCDEWYKANKEIHELKQEHQVALARTRRNHRIFTEAALLIIAAAFLVVRHYG